MKEDLKCEFYCQRQRVMFPKNGKYEDGDFAIVSARVVETIQGNPKLHEIYQTITLKGKLAYMEDGGTYRVVAKEVYDEKFRSYNYNVEFMNEIIKVDTKEEQYDFLSTFLTDKQVHAIFETYDNPMEIIINKNIEGLCKVKGMGEATANKIIERFNKSKDYARAYMELMPYGLTQKLINKLCEHYGGEGILLKKIKDNPYVLADEVNGVGFKKADEIALKMGANPHGTNRGISFVNYFLEQEAQKGNSYVYTHSLMNNIVENLGEDYPDESISIVLQDMIKKQTLWHNTDKTMIALNKYYQLERNIAQEIFRLRDCGNTFDFVGWEDKIKHLEELQGWQYTDEQWNSIQATLEHNVVLITGLGGTGKSTSVLGMLKALDLDETEFAQTALSGKASVNLTDVTGYEGYTIHRLLGYNPQGGFAHNRDTQLDRRVIILDELSMVDAKLFYSLIQAIPNGSKLIMLGDDGQLESIGVGNIIYDLIESGAIKHCNLTKVHRQASKSAIITESHKIRHSTQIVDKDFEGEITLGELQDLHLIGYHESDFKEVGTPKPTIDLMVEKYKEKLKLTDNINDICAILPTKTSGSSCYKMNQIIQQIVIPTKMMRGITIGERSKNPYTIYRGDKVINLVNDRKASYITPNGEEVVRPIFNGNMGIVQQVDIEMGTIIVDFDNIGLVTIPRHKLSNIDLAYCITTHKMQGASSKYLICGLDNSHYIMQTRELVYTMLTRAKKHCDFIFETKALVRAIKNTNVQHKQTFLPYFLNGTLK